MFVVAGDSGQAGLFPLPWLTVVTADPVAEIIPAG